MEEDSLTPEKIALVQRELERIGAACEVAKKPKSGRWETVHPRIETIEDALEAAAREVDADIVAGVLLVHEVYGGIILWDSDAPTVINDLGRIP